MRGKVGERVSPQRDTPQEEKALTPALSRKRERERTIWCGSKAPVGDVNFLLNDVFRIDRCDNLAGNSVRSGGLELRQRRMGSRWQV